MRSFPLVPRTTLIGLLLLAFAGNAAAEATLTDSIAPGNDQSLRFANTVGPGTTGTGTVTITGDPLVSLDVQVTEGLEAPFSLPTPATCDGITLAPAASCSLAVQFTPTAPGLVTDSFTLKAGASTFQVAVSGTPGLANADLQVSKTADQSLLQPGVSGSDLATYTVTVRNNGPDTADAVVTDLLPLGLDFVSAAPGQGTYAAGTGEWEVGALATGAEVTLQLATQAVPGTSGCIVNTATVAPTATGVDEIPGNNSAAFVAGAPACADLAITQLATDGIDLGAAPARLPGCVEVKTVVSVRNAGPGPATGVRLTVDRFEPVSNRVPPQCSSAPVTPLLPGAGQQFVVGDIPAGQSVDVTVADFVVARNADAELSYEFSLAGAEPDPETSNNRESGDDDLGPIIVCNGCSCFIATAAYGSWLDAEVLVLRQFRDRILLPNPAGRAFVAWYYRVSPPLAAYIRDRDWLRTLTRAALTPLVYAIKYPTATLILVPGLMFMSTWAWHRRRRRTKPR